MCWLLKNPCKIHSLLKGILKFSIKKKLAVKALAVVLVLLTFAIGAMFLELGLALFAAFNPGQGVPGVDGRSLGSQPEWFESVINSIG